MKNSPPRVTIDEMDNGDLVINPTIPVDTGNYTCSAQREGDQTILTARLTITVASQYTTVNVRLDSGSMCIYFSLAEKPFFYGPDHVNLTVFEGERLELNCSGYFVKVTWSQDGAPLPYGIVNNSPNISLLLVLAVKQRDGGTYMCHITGNTARAVADKTFQVVVRGCPDILSVSRPQIRFVRDNVTMICKAVDGPQPAISWCYSSPQCSDAGAVPRCFELHGVLVLKSITVGDAGNYTCLAHNSEFIKGQSTSLTVIEGMATSLGDSR